MNKPPVTGILSPSARTVETAAGPRGVAARIRPGEPGDQPRLQITGGEPTIDKDFPDAYRLAFELGMMLTVSTNGSRLRRPGLLEMLTELPPYRLVISLYGTTEAAYDGLTQRRGSYKAFRRGIAAALEARLPARLNIVVTDVSADETAAMVAVAEEWGIEHNVYTNIQPIYFGCGWQRRRRSYQNDVRGGFLTRTDA